MLIVVVAIFCPVFASALSRRSCASALLEATCTPTPCLEPHCSRRELLPVRERDAWWSTRSLFLKPYVEPAVDLCHARLRTFFPRWLQLNALGAGTLGSR